MGTNANLMPACKRAPPKIAAVILAAGESSRMGAFKPLLPLVGSTPIELTVSRFRAAGIREVLVVTGHKAELLVPILASLDATQVFNAGWKSGMLSSILAGRNGLHPDFDAFFLLPVDIPLVKIDTLETLVREYETNRAPVVYPRFLGLRGHPPLIAAAVPIPETAPDTHGGLAGILSTYDDRAVDVDVPDRGITMDFDTPADYRKLQAYACREDIPTEKECRAIWIQCNVPEQVKIHSAMVAELARILAASLNRNGMRLDVGLIVSAALLHDIARPQPDHATAGAGILARMGYPRVARIVADHVDLRGGGEGLTESALVYLADKCILDNRPVSLDERFRAPLTRFAHTPGALENALRRKHDAEQIAALLEDALGASVADTVGKHWKAILAAPALGRRYIYLLRHGAIRSHAGRNRFIGQSDIPLSGEGARQARKLAENLSETPISAIFCSDLGRSLRTAEIIARPHRLQPCVREELREINLGEWDGLAFDVIRRRCPEQFEERGRDMVHFRPPAGESFLDCAMRVLPVFFDIVRSASGNVVIVGHAGINRIILCRVLGIGMERLFEFNQNYGCTNLIHLGDSGFKLEVLNDAVFSTPLSPPSSREPSPL